MNANRSTAWTGGLIILLVISIGLGSVGFLRERSRADANEIRFLRLEVRHADLVRELEAVRGRPSEMTLAPRNESRSASEPVPVLRSTDPSIESTLVAEFRDVLAATQDPSDYGLPARVGLVEGFRVPAQDFLRDPVLAPAALVFLSHLPGTSVSDFQNYLLSPFSWNERTQVAAATGLVQVLLRAPHETQSVLESLAADPLAPRRAVAASVWRDRRLLIAEEVRVQALLKMLHDESGLVRSTAAFGLTGPELRVAAVGRLLGQFPSLDAVTRRELFDSLIRSALPGIRVLLIESCLVHGDLSRGVADDLRAYAPTWTPEDLVECLVLTLDETPLAAALREILAERFNLGPIADSAAFFTSLYGREDLMVICEQKTQKPPLLAMEDQLEAARAAAKESRWDEVSSLLANRRARLMIALESASNGNLPPVSWFGVLLNETTNPILAPLLVRWLQTASTEESLSIAQFLAKLRHPLGVETLVALASRDGDDESSLKTFRLLRDINTPEARVRLENEFLVAPPDRARRIGDLLHETGQAWSRPAIQKLLTDSSLSHEWVGGLLVSLHKTQGSGFRSLLADVLLSGAPKWRSAGLRGLGIRPEPHLSTVFKGYLNDEDPEVRAAALEALGSMNPMPIDDLVMAQLKHESPVVRRALALLLAKSDREVSTGSLIVLSRDVDILVRRAAVGSLGFHTSPKVIPALRGRLDDDDATVRSLSRRAMVQRGRVDVMEGLIQDLNDTVLQETTLEFLRTTFGMNLTSAEEWLNWWNLEGKRLHTKEAR